jgi:septal ring factor EnvC (AmiA/AmiB activator)
MEDAVTAQARERVTRWIEESRELLALLPGLLAADHKSEQAERDTDRLRKDAEALRKEIGDLRKENLELKKGHDDVYKTLDDLKQQNETLRAEKEEAAGAFAKLLDTVQSTNQIAQKLGMTKSPFARHPAPAASPAASPASIPNPTPHE